MFKAQEVKGAAPQWYTPEAHDNRKDPEPFRVFISPITAAELATLEQDASGVTELAGNFGGQLNFTRRALFDRHVHDLTGYESKSAPKTGAHLFDSLMACDPAWARPIIHEICDAIANYGKLKAGVLDAPGPH